MGNRSRDIRNQLSLIRLGWRIVIVWECELRSETSQRLDDLAEEIRVCGRDA